MAALSLAAAALSPTWILSALLYLCSLLFLCFKWWQMHPNYGSNVGPPVLPLLGSFPSLLRNQHRMYDWATDLLRRSPSLTIRNVLFGLQLYTTANPANVEYMLKTNFQNYTKGFRFQGLMSDMLGHGIFNVDGEQWKAQRKAASYEFTSNSLKTLMLDSVQREISDRLLPVLYGRACRRVHEATASLESDGDVESAGELQCAAPVDLQEIFLRFAFDNICQISLGVDPGCLNQSLSTHSFAKAFDDATELIIQRFFSPAWLWQVKRYLNIGSERRLKSALLVVHGFAMEVIKRRRQACIQTDANEWHQPSDLLFRLLGIASQPRIEQQAREQTGKPSAESRSEAPADATGEEMRSDELVRDMIISFLLAGRDTSSIALSWFFWLLIQHPEVEATIVREIETVVEESRRGRRSCASPRASGDGDARSRVGIGKATGMQMLHGSDAGCCRCGDGRGHGSIAEPKQDGEPSAAAGGCRASEKQSGCNVGSSDEEQAYEAFTYEELKEMRFLQAALQEAMRLYPPVPHDTKLVVEEDVLPDGTRLRAGAQLAYHAYAMGRMESIWGEDWASFRPERWTETQQQGSVSPFKWPVFQAGPRICLGKDMAMLQMKCVAAALIQRFSMKLADGYPGPRLLLSFTLKMQNGLPVVLHPRQRAAAAAVSELP